MANRLANLLHAPLLSTALLGAVASLLTAQPGRAQSLLDVAEGLGELETLGLEELKLRCPGAGPNDPDCARRLLTLLGSVKILTTQAEGGMTIDEKGVDGGALKFSTQLIDGETKSGNTQAILFDAAYLGNDDAKSFRVRFTLADIEALFICKDASTGDATIPLLNQDTNCKLGGVWSYLGFGGKLFEIQKDTAAGRIAARWAEIHAVLNFLGNANKKDYLRKRLQLYTGMSVDTLWYKDTPGARGSDTLPRGNFGLSGLLRSDNNHWELRGLAGFRPNFKDISEFTIETRTQALYHLLLAPETVMSIGLDAQYQYNKNPENSFGPFVSDRDNHSLYLGSVLGFTFR